MTGDQARALREELYDAGFRPVAISNPEADHPSAGKAPFGHDWTNRARLDPPEALRVLRLDALNTGVLCDGLRALDIDVDDAALVQRIRATAVMAWGEAPMRVRDNSPRCLLLYRAAEGEPPKRQVAGKHGKVEVLGRGQQFVAYGRHPTGAELRWMPEPPHSIAREQLPTVTEDQITRFFAQVAPMLGAAGEKAAGSAVKAEDTAEVRALLDAMADLGAGEFTGPAHLPADTAGRLHEALARSGRARDRWNGLCDDLIEGGKDRSRSGMDMSLAALLKAAGLELLDVALALLVFAHGAAQVREKHSTGAQRLRYAARTALRAGQARDERAGDGAPGGDAPWPPPQRELATADALPPPPLALDIFPAPWPRWIARAAASAGAPPDYVACALLAVAGAAIGNARWGSPWEGWQHPPVVNVACIGLPSAGKSPAINAVAEPLVALAGDLNDDFDDRMRAYRTAKQEAKERRALWEAEVKEAVRDNRVPPSEPPGAAEPERPWKRRACSTDPTVEAARDLSAANPRGLLLHRDELAGWVGGMDRYGKGGAGADRAFWLQAYDGGRWTADRVKDGDEGRDVPHLTWGILGGIQPDRLAAMLLSGDDDGLSARFLYTWPAPSAEVSDPPDGKGLPFALKPMLRRLRDLPMPDEPEPVVLPFTGEAVDALQDWRREVKRTEQDAAGLFLSWLGKLPGMAVRLAVVFLHLEWLGRPAGAPPPEAVDLDALARALGFLADYAVPMARRAFGEAALPEAERDARRLARWLLRRSPVPETLNARALRRQADGPGIATPERIEVALGELAELGWVRPARAREGGGKGRQRADWSVNPALRESAP